MTYGHLRADCLYTGIISGPNTRYNRVNVCIHDTTGLTTGCIVYANIKLVVKPVRQPVELTVPVCSTRLSNRLSGHCGYLPFDNRFDSRLDVCLHDTAGCQTGFYSTPVVTCLTETTDSAP